MRQMFVATDNYNENEAYLYCPWASIIVEVEGGYHAFESWDEYEVWKNQI